MQEGEGFVPEGGAVLVAVTVVKEVKEVRVGGEAWEEVERETWSGG